MKKNNQDTSNNTPNMSKKTAQVVRPDIVHICLYARKVCLAPLATLPAMYSLGLLIAQLTDPNLPIDRDLCDRP